MLWKQECVIHSAAWRVLWRGFSCAGLGSMPVSVFVIKDSEVLLLNCRRILTLCSRTCHFHSLLIQNILKGLAQKIGVYTKSAVYVSKNTKDKLLAIFLIGQNSKEAQSLLFPVNGRP